MSGYYENRTHCQYYALVREWLESYGDQESILDIGSADTPVSSWGSFRYRFAIDARQRVKLPNVTAIRGEWPAAAIQLPQQISVITCLQVIEHIEAVQPFIDAIFAVATHRVILSVPYMWREGAAKSHIHDPIHRRKLREWTRRKPSRTQLVISTGGDRLVEEYLPNART